MTPRASGSRGDLLIAKMHTDEIEIDETLVRRLLGEQFPDWVDRPLRRVEPEGTDNAIFRLGEDLSVSALTGGLRTLRYSPSSRSRSASV